MTRTIIPPSLWSKHICQLRTGRVALSTVVRGTSPKLPEHRGVSNPAFLPTGEVCLLPVPLQAGSESAP
ncbi:hypothetical protein UA08_02052 [Talaromyces atroroseus]|uniref:Uncharacterized protein n=1 Tax=Talaromyces atroroseus TaxID=1441469 RepID=A0A1Q5QCA4_TALAT|nr:hypothetical protein UA08_02052 [Talaromyces atroroseus]OKL63511.1 hypothetical protein UA08_02052 [Talaromyces atroroseus]